MEWAKPDGQIAFALHARLLFQQGDGMPIARQALFEALDVTSVVNGVELRQTKVWPKVSAPFCILFATDRTPGVEAGFRFLSPRFEESLNSAGGMRIDAVNAEVVPSRQLVDTPEILKILFRGSKADLGILERIRAQGHRTLADFWHERIHDPRSADLFAGPQTIVHKSPPAATGRIGVAVCDEGVVYNETFYGYSLRVHPDAALLVRYLALVLGSRLVVWLALVTSGEFGFEREVIEKATLDGIPLPDFDKLTQQQRKDIEYLVGGLQSGKVSWEEVDEWVMRLYGLCQRDLQVVFDTLKFNLPFAENKRKAQAVPSSDERRRFCDVLREELTPWCDRFGSRLAVNPIPVPVMSPWQAIAVRTSRREPPKRVPPSDWAGLLKAADEAAASEILVENGSTELLIGRLAQMRYWSTTQARLLAQRIAWSHVELLSGIDEIGQVPSSRVDGNRARSRPCRPHRDNAPSGRVRPPPTGGEWDLHPRIPGWKGSLGESG